MAAKKADDKAAEKSSKSGDVGEAEVQAKFDAAHKVGYSGVSTDPTPNENYTIRGVLAGKPTPETDYDAALEAVKVRVDGVEGVQPPSK
jgi:hypothetical protein